MSIIECYIPNYGQTMSRHAYEHLNKEFAQLFFANIGLNPMNMNSLKITNKIDDLLHHSSEHLQEVKDQIPYWSREEQAKYADEVCRESVDNEYTEFIQQQMDAVENTNDVDFFKTFNTTSIGNLALLSLRAPSPYKEKAEEILQNYTKYHLGAKK